MQNLAGSQANEVAVLHASHFDLHRLKIGIPSAPKLRFLPAAIPDASSQSDKVDNQLSEFCQGT